MKTRPAASSLKAALVLAAAATSRPSRRREAQRRRKSSSRVRSPARPPCASCVSTAKVASRSLSGVAFTLLDEYQRTIFVSGRLQYNIFDWLGIGVFGGFAPMRSA